MTVRRRNWWSYQQCLLLLFLLLLLLQGATMVPPPFARYQAYLVFLGVFALTAPLNAYFAASVPSWRAALHPQHLLPIAAIAALFVSLLFTRSLGYLYVTTSSCTNIYQQQIQMARFIGRYYPGATIAANDIGAINYFNDIRCLDLEGLASMPVATIKQMQGLDRVAD